MKIKIAGKINNCGWRKQLIIDTDKKTYSYGSFLFHSANINDLTQKQLKECLQVLKDNDFMEVERC
jgi:hypothetical protein